MDQDAIFGPVLAMVGLTFAVWVFLFAKRIPFINESGITPTDLAVPGRLAEISPPEVSNPSDNLKNLFEIPVLFYVLALVLHATEGVDGVAVTLGWVFFAFRALHSIVHCTFNGVMLRFTLYAIASTAVWILAARTAWHLLA